MASYALTLWRNHNLIKYMIFFFSKILGHIFYATTGFKYLLRMPMKLALLPLLFLPSLSLAVDKPFNNGANWGGTGLMEIPTARVLDDGEVRFGYAQADPYRWYTGGMGIFPGLELSGRFTEVSNIPTRLGPSYGAYKDKAFDLKYQILPESKLLPALAVGLHDFHGTQLYEAQYLTLSRQIFPLDFTFGLGRKRLKSSTTFPLWDDLGIFGGIEWAVNRNVHLMAEYNPIEYEKDKRSARGVPEGANSPINLGLRIKILEGVDLGVSYQRGDTIGFMCQLHTLLGEPLLPKRPDPALQYPVDRRPFNKRDPKKMVEQIHQAIKKAGFKDVSVYTNGTGLTAEFENTRYLSEKKAAGRALRILLFHSPENTKMLTVILKRRQIPLLSVSVRPDHLEAFLYNRIKKEVFLKLVNIEPAKPAPEQAPDPVASTKEDQKFNFRYGIKPDLQTLLNDPSGVFKYRPGIKPYFISSLWKGAAFYARYDIPFYSNISSSNTPELGAVRTDAWLYKDRNYSFDKLMVDQVFKISPQIFGRLSGGYLEKMYAGAGAEILTFPGLGNLALGLETDWVKKRERHSQFDLLDFEAHTILGSISYHIPQIAVTLSTRYGRFLAGDKGCVLDVSRQYNTGATVGFWYSFTDTDHMTGFNKGYNDKGVYLTLPARMFLERDSNLKYNYSIAPWTRDVAATVSRWQSLFDLTNDLTPSGFKQDLGTLKD